MNTKREVGNKAPATIPNPLSSFNNYTLSLKESLGRMLTQAEVKIAMYFYIRATDVAATLIEINKENK